jgi:hypothetical protein
MNKVPFFREISETCTRKLRSIVTYYLHRDSMSRKHGLERRNLDEAVKSKQKELVARQKSQKFYYD